MVSSYTPYEQRQGDSYCYKPPRKIVISLLNLKNLP